MPASTTSSYTRHELWQQMPQSGGLALHVSGEFPGIDLELWAIRG